ncbi:flagellar motor switch protein FliM [Angelakisella massiliensis]|uniref:flagellar motor switch protein FliM n=1 Tax=Angelakisella massiliensis TaxID=1871018 RepID=UPI0024B231B8|nr:flagellar motor switch protein FliM [Angelakisella massiliensis]
MAEVLSQSQIDSLLKAARSGEMDLEATKEKSGEKKYRKYDFYSPRKFTKDRLKMLGSIFENYTRILNSRINGLLHTTCEIEVESVEEQRYYEFSNALSEGDVLSLAEVEIEKKTQQEETPVLFHFTTSLMLSMMDRLMGGDGNLGMRISAGYNMTDLELKLYESIVKDMIQILGNSWENYLDVDFKFRRVETNPTLVQLIGVDETVVIVGVSIRFPNVSGQMNICLPGMMLTNIFGKITSGNQTGRGGGEDNSEEIMGILRDSQLELTAELGRTTLQLQDIYCLHVGDVIDLGHAASEPVQLYVGGRPWFSGKIGTQNDYMAVKVVETYEDHGRREK